MIASPENLPKVDSKPVFFLFLPFAENGVERSLPNDFGLRFGGTVQQTERVLRTLSRGGLFAFFGSEDTYKTYQPRFSMS
jgi:hypothetical protein